MSDRHLTPATPEQFARLKEVEREREKFDKEYLSMEKAEAIPKELLAQDPMLLARVRRSSEEWPENQLSATQVLKDAPTDQGQTDILRRVDTGKLFGYDPDIAGAVKG